MENEKFNTAKPKIVICVTHGAIEQDVLSIIDELKQLGCDVYPDVVDMHKSIVVSNHKGNSSFGEDFWKRLAEIPDAHTVLFINTVGSIESFSIEDSIQLGFALAYQKMIAFIKPVSINSLDTIMEGYQRI